MDKSDKAKNSGRGEKRDKRGPENERKEERKTEMGHLVRNKRVVK